MGRRLRAALLAVVLAVQPALSFAACPPTGLDWGGYCIAGTGAGVACSITGPGDDTGVFTEVFTFFRVPYAAFKTAGQDLASTYWVGIGDGNAHGNILQTGVEIILNTDASTQYSAWYSYLDGGAVHPFPGLAPKPMDVMSFDAKCTATSGSPPTEICTSVTFTVVDYTQNITVTTTQMPSNDSYVDTAEWVQEVNDTNGPLNDGFVPWLHVQYARTVGGSLVGAGLTSTFAITSQGHGPSGTFGGPPNATGDGFNLAYTPTGVCPTVDSNVQFIPSVGLPN